MVAAEYEAGAANGQRSTSKHETGKHAAIIELSSDNAVVQDIRANFGKVCLIIVNRKQREEAQT
jgi:hypothetical protein